MIEVNDENGVVRNFSHETDIALYPYFFCCSPGDGIVNLILKERAKRQKKLANIKGPNEPRWFDALAANRAVREGAILSTKIEHFPISIQDF
jgi:hypothetical protein